jgi:hypothetical protein
MPKRSSDKEQEVLGQIFDFIFKEAKKKPDKRKPIKVSGLNGGGMLTDAIAAALEKPGAFLTEQAAKDLGDSLDVTLFKMLPNQADVTAPIKISATKMVDIVKDPMGYMQKMKDVADANRKSGKAAFMGKIMREFVTNGWARKYADIDTQQAVRLGLASQESSKQKQSTIQYKEKWDTRAALGQSASGKGDALSNEIVNMQERGANLIGRNTFTEKGWNSLSEKQKDSFISIFGLAQKVKDSGNLDIDYVSERLGKELENQGFKNTEQILDRYKKVVTKNGNDGSISLADSGFYRNLEMFNIDNRISQLKSQNYGLTQSEIDSQINTLEKAKIVISGQDLTNKSLREAKGLLDKSIAETREQLRFERDPEKKAELRRKYRNLQGDSREIATMSFWSNVGKAEGYWSSAQNLIDGNLLTTILNGDFFDPNKNDLAPSEEKKLFGAAYFVPKMMDKDQGRKFNKMELAYHSSLTQLYYLTPRAWMRTFLFNGEGFAYLAHLQNVGSTDYIRKMLSKNGGSTELSDSLFEGLGDSSMASIMSGKSDEIIKKILDASGLTGTQLEALKKGLEGKFKGIAILGQFHKFFSFNARLKDKVAKGIEAFMSKRRQKILDKFMESAIFKKFFSGDAALLLGQWAKKGGLQNVARALVVAVANALGLATTGGVANILINLVAAVVADALFAVGKVLFGIVIFAIIGLVGLMFMVTSQQNTASKQTYAYASTNPGEVVVNPNYYIDDEYIITGGDPGAPGTVYTGNAQQIYEQVRKEFGLSIPLRLVTCTDGPDPDEAACAKISWAWCYSDSGEIICRADKIASSRSEAGLTNLFRHELVHQIQRGGTTKLREWGADYLSNNGGGYKFNTRDGIKRATEIGSYLIGTGICSDAQLREIAVGTGYGTPCGAALNGYAVSIYIKP